MVNKVVYLWNSTDDYSIMQAERQPVVPHPGVSARNIQSEMKM